MTRAQAQGGALSSEPADNRYVFVTGGARSGKTSFAIEKAQAVSGMRVYLATAPSDGSDDEMRLRIERHKAERDGSWQTIEEPVNVSLRVRSADDAGVILIDCLTLWVSNLMERGMTDAEILTEASLLARTCSTSKGPVITVTNEVGWGIVPENALARRFRDVSGGVNRIMASAAGQAYLVASGLPVRLR